MEKLKQKAQEVCSDFEKDREIVSCGYIGSLSRGFADEYSDLDLIFILKSNKNVTSIKKKLLTLNKNARIMGDQIHFLYKDTTTSIAFKSILDLDRKIKDLEDKFDISLYKQVYFMRDYQAISGDRRKIEGIRKRIPSKLPKKFIVEEINGLSPWINNNVKENGRLGVEIKRKNLISFEYRFSRTIGWLIKLVYEINGFLFEDARWAFKEIPKMKLKPINFVKRLEKSINSNDLETKLKLLRSIVYDFDRIIKDM